MKHRFLHLLSQFIVRFPKTIVVVSLATSLVSGLVVYRGIVIDADQDNLISESLPYHKRYRDFLREFGDLEYVFVVFEVPEGKTDEAKKALLSLVEKIRSRTDLFREIHYREDLTVFEDRALLLLPDEEFRSLTSHLSRWSEPIKRLTSVTDYTGLFRVLADLFQTPMGKVGDNGQLQEGFKLFQTLLDGLRSPEAIDSLSLGDLFAPIVGKGFTRDPEGFFLSQSGTLLFLKVMPVKDFSTMKVVEEPMTFLRKQLTEVRAEFPSVPMGVTGRPALQYEEITSSGSDSFWASLSSILGVALLYIFFLRQLRRPLLIILCLVCGIAWSAAFIALALGHLNLLTVVFAIILVGLGVDYGMHFLLRYLKERRDGLGGAEAIDRTLKTVGGGIVTGALASVVSFLSALLTDFRGLQELGLVAGAGLLFCVIAMLVTFPAVLVLWDREIESKVVSRRSKVVSHLLSTFIVRNPATMLIILVVLALLSLPLVAKVRFENNLLKLQDPGLESVRYEKKILNDTGIGTWFAAFVTPSRDRLAEIEKKLSGLETVSAFESIRSIVPPDQGQRISLLSDLKKQLTHAPFVPTRSVDRQELETSLGLLHRSLGTLQEKAFASGEAEGVEEIEQATDKITEILDWLQLRPEEAIPILENSQRRFFRFFVPAVGTFQNLLSPPPLDESDLPAPVRDRFIGKTGNHVLYAYPEEDIWHWDAMKKFLDDMRAIDPHVTGAPVSVYESATRMKRGFYLILSLTTVLIIIILAIDLRNAAMTAVAVAPLAFGILWLLFWMGLFDIPFNLGNFFGLPVIAGLGIDSGIHLIHRYREKRDIGDMLKTVSPAIIISTLTSLIGFGALSFVRHRGLASFGQLMSLGSLTTLAAALVIVPLLLKVVYGKNK